MKRLSIDFDNHCLCIMTEGQQGTEIVPELDKATHLLGIFKLKLLA